MILNGNIWKLDNAYVKYTMSTLAMLDFVNCEFSTENLNYFKMMTFFNFTVATLMLQI